jgi:putative transcriptional regulator
MGTGKKFHSLKGQLLLDGGQLVGSFFHHTVVLICQHDPEGAFGLVINRVSENKVGEVLVADLPEPLRESLVYVGGPVQSGALSYLHAGDLLPDANVMDGLKIGHSVDELVELSETMVEPAKIRVFAGYAGWSPGQLDEEMKRAAWISHPASLDLIFHADPQNLWSFVLKKKGWQYRLLADSPPDLSWN